jgi:cation diffusion facilitator CzcD-associated flavoprotein CzcO/acetyl esterase/lipase
MPDPNATRSPNSRDGLSAIIVGTGFAGLGMAVALRKQGISDFVILEKTADVGGVWRDNSYPGAACDVPSHLYSFSFEPNPRWSRVFSPQSEILDYLRHCAQKYELLRHIRFGAEVSEAEYDEDNAHWTVTLTDGTRLSARLLITGTGQLSRPAYPRLEGMADFKGHSFHSATWDHGYALAGKRVAVVGTGASAIQFVPAIAGRVAQLKVFQRSPAYILPRPDRAYSELEKTLFGSAPWLMKLLRTSIYVRYESQALAFTRFKWLMKIAGGVPFRRLLRKQVKDPALRAKMVPDYPIGCKRILLSSEYLATFAQPHVALLTEGIRRITPEGIETNDGRHHAVDAIIYGTGFAATEFLAPMRIKGRGGQELNAAWSQGAQAYLGLAVPGFPNFFMLYGPNTNLGHNSIVYMLESQIAHVMRCLQAMRASQTNTVEVLTAPYTRFNARVQSRLAHTVWNGCRSWYVDARGHNSNNWPGFTLTYRWLTQRASLDAYQFTHMAKLPTAKTAVAEIAEPRGLFEAANAAFLRGFLRVAFRTLIGPPVGPGVQRRWTDLLSLLMPGRSGVVRSQTMAAGVPVEVIAPRAGKAGGAILYLHGGAFLLGGANTHRSITSHLAYESGMPVWVPNYRLAPEHPYPAALDDVTAAYRALVSQGYTPGSIVVAGDSAGGALALALAISLRDRGEALPAGLMLISPVTDPTLSGASLTEKVHVDPMVRRGWLEQGLRCYQCPPGTPAHSPLQSPLDGLPPMLIQVGDREILLADSTRLAEHAAQCGVDCTIEIHRGRWHVFHLQPLYLRSAVRALQTLARFAVERVAAPAAAAQPVTPA